MKKHKKQKQKKKETMATEKQTENAAILYFPPPPLWQPALLACTLANTLHYADRLWHILIAFSRFRFLLQPFAFYAIDFWLQQKWAEGGDL